MLATYPPGMCMFALENSEENLEQVKQFCKDQRLTMGDASITVDSDGWLVVILKRYVRFDENGKALPPTTEKR
jgi:hypothetical protein